MEEEVATDLVVQLQGGQELVGARKVAAGGDGDGPFSVFGGPCSVVSNFIAGTTGDTPRSGAESQGYDKEAPGWEDAASRCGWILHDLPQC
jgi:hypothetical protein